MKYKTWQDDTLQQLKDLLQPFDAVQAVFVVGSLANDSIQPDFWSDIDLLIAVSDPAISQFYPGTDWLKPINSVFATSHSQAPPRHTLRVCFTDMRRVDFIFSLASAFDDPNSMNLQCFQAGHRVLFSKAPHFERELSKKAGILPSENNPDAEFLALGNDFRFKGMLAVYKVVRDDLLIALHLALDLMRDCLVLRMMLRDREKDTSHHRIGGTGNELVTQMNSHPQDYSAGGILAMIDYYSQIFDNLAKKWSPSYQLKRDPLLVWSNLAKEYLSPQEDFARKDTVIRS